MAYKEEVGDSSCIPTIFLKKLSGATNILLGSRQWHVCKTRSMHQRWQAVTEQCPANSDAYRQNQEGDEGQEFANRG